jgi:hypothetical protein
MNCNSVQSQLSDYFDGELSESVALEVRQHLQACTACQAELDGFQTVRMALATPVHGGAPPWSAVQEKLLTDEPVSPAATVQLARPAAEGTTNRRSKWIRDVVVIAGSLAASALILVWTVGRNDVPVQVASHDASSMQREASVTMKQPSDGAVASHGHAGHQHAGGHRHAAHGGEVAAVVDLHDTLNQHAVGTDAAMLTLANRYNGKDASLDEVVASFGRRPSIESMLPPSVKLVSTKLLEMPQCNCSEGECTCGPGRCNCVAAVCERPDGSTFLVVEQCRGQDVKFGDAPTQIVRRGEHELKVAQASNALAVSWQAAGGRLTAFGLNDLEELDQMLAMN